MTPQVIVLDAGNTVSEYHRIPDLHEMQRIVGGYIEGVAMPQGMYGFVNEEGALQGMFFNAPAQRLMGRPFYIRGPLIITGGADKNGDTLPLTDKQIEYVRVKLIGG